MSSLEMSTTAIAEHLRTLRAHRLTFGHTPHVRARVAIFRDALELCQMQALHSPHGSARERILRDLVERCQDRIATLED